MSKVRVPYGDSAKDTATLLLAAVEEDKDLDPSVVEVSSLGGFLVPEEVAKSAGVKYEDPEEADGSRYSEAQVAEAEKTPLVTGEGTESEPKKTAAKKTAKKSTAKKGA